MQSSLHKPPAMAQAPNPKPTGGGGGMSAGQISGIGAQAADLAGNALESLKPVGPFNTWGIETQTKKGNNMSVGASALKGVGKGASMGASIGSIIPGWGTAAGAVIGGAIGGVTGLLKGKKKVKDEAAEIKDNTQLAYEGYHQKANAAQYAALAKHGAKLETMKKLKSAKRNAVSWHGKKFKMKSGGKLDKPGEVNIIPSGTLHKENNNLGQKDKGLPIVDEGGKKIFEVEREELILRLKTTKDVEQFVDSYKKTHNDKHLVDLGKLLSKEIMTNTQDFSGKFGLEAK
jgi:gas vesicle protein